MADKPLALLNSQMYSVVAAIKYKIGPSTKPSVYVKKWPLNFRQPVPQNSMAGESFNKKEYIRRDSHIEGTKK